MSVSPLHVSTMAHVLTWSMVISATALLASPAPTVKPTLMIAVHSLVLTEAAATTSLTGNVNPGIYLLS